MDATKVSFFSFRYTFIFPPLNGQRNPSCLLFKLTFSPVYLPPADFIPQTPSLPVLPVTELFLMRLPLAPLVLALNCVPPPLLSHLFQAPLLPFPPCIFFLSIWTRIYTDSLLLYFPEPACSPLASRLPLDTIHYQVALGSSLLASAPGPPST